MASNVTLNPLVAQDPTTEHRINQKWQRIWSIAFVTSAVALTALATFAVALTSTLWPAHLPAVTLLTLAGGLPLCGKVITHIWQRAETYKRGASHTLHLSQRLECLSDQALLETLKEMKICSEAELTVQKRAIALYSFFTEDADKWLERAQTKEEVDLYFSGQIHRVKQSDYHIGKVNFSDPKQVQILEELQKSQIATMQALYYAALSRLKAAYALHLAQSPTNVRPFADFVNLTTTSPLPHLIASEAKDPTAQAMAVAGGKTYTHREILALPTEELAKQLFGTKLK